MTSSVLHVIPSLGAGGGGRAALTAAVAAAEHADEDARIASLRPAHPWMLEDAASAGVDVFDAPAPEELMEEMAAADLVQLHYWNSPELQELLEHDLPETRLLVWAHVAGHTSPQLLPPELIAAADVNVATSRLNARVTAATLAPGIPDAGLPVIPPVGGWNGIEPSTGSGGDGFVIGYVGTVGFVKLAPEFAELCAGVNVPDARFVVCGTGDAARSLPGQVAELGLADRFEFHGHVRDVGPVLAGTDVLGYPLRSDCSASSDLVVKEAMYAAVPPVVLPHAGADELVDHGRTGLIAHDQADYVRSIEKLHADDAERERLGANARKHAERHWAPEVVGRQWRTVHRQALAEPKRKRPPIVAAPRPDIAGAERFLRGIGPDSPAFRVSMDHTGGSPIPADDEIGRCSTPVGLGEGGLVDFGRRYSEDPLLALWAGLFMGAHGRPVLAAGLLSRAQALGCAPGRVAPHLEELMAT
jgi:hypothetical protein